VAPLSPASVLWIKKQENTAKMVTKNPRHDCFILNWDTDDGLAAV
jgi:hypothetical protein